MRRREGKERIRRGREGGRKGDYSCHNTLQKWNWAEHWLKEDELSCTGPKNVKINTDNMEIN